MSDPSHNTNTQLSSHLAKGSTPGVRIVKLAAPGSDLQTTNQRNNGPFTLAVVHIVSKG
jgi:hypothetical protein